MRWLVAGLTALIAVGLAPAASAASPDLPRASASGSGPLVYVKADTRYPGRRIPPSFLGTSQEYGLIEHYTGNARTGVNPIAVALFEELAQFGGGPPTLRVGGGSTDDAWWNPTGRPAPHGIYINIRQSLLDGLAEFLRTTGSRAVLGLNLGAGEPRIAADWAAVARREIGRRHLLGFELGNEPEYYPKRTYMTEDGRRVRFRGKRWGPRAHRRQMGRFLDAISLAVADVRTGGPATLPVPAWMKALPKLLDRHGDRMGEVTLHMYALTGCGVRGGARTRERLLSRDTLVAGIRNVSHAARLAHRYRRKLRLSETNSAACGGVEGVSNGYVASLWSLDWLFGMAAAGVDAVNLHSSSPRYRPFGARLTGPRQWAGVVGPTFYGMRAFAEATANRARILPSAYHARLRTRRTNVTSWGFHDTRARQVRVVLLNKGARTGMAKVRVPGARGAGRVKRMRGRSLGSSEGIRWGGQAYASPTVDGRLEGRERTSRVGRRRKATYRFRLPARSAAMLTVAVRRR